MTAKTTKPRATRSAPAAKSLSTTKTGAPNPKPPSAGRAKSPKVPSKQPVPITPEPKQPASKQSQLIELLRSPEGSSMASMTHLTGWQPHTVRATISATLRKKLGHNVVCAANPAGERLYRIAPPAKKA